MIDRFVFLVLAVLDDVVVLQLPVLVAQRNSSLSLNV